MGRDTHGSHFPQRNYTHYVVLQIDVEPSVTTVFDFEGAELIGCRFLLIINMSLTFFIDMALVEFGLCCQI